MNKLNAEQIKMALECCISAGDCTFCPLRDVQSCPGVLEENALALICKYEKLIENARSKSKTSEVADELERYIRLNEDIAITCKEENGEQNREYWKGKLSAFKQIRGFIDAELKKKYTEEGK